MISPVPGMGELRRYLPRASAVVSQPGEHEQDEAGHPDQQRFQEAHGPAEP